VKNQFARFMDKVVVNPTGCWLWTGACNSCGYGSIRIENKDHKAHRLAYELFVGPIEDIRGTDCRGTCVIHSCDTPLCVNPAHLRLGTHKENMEDKAIRGRVVNHPLLGEEHQNSKLTVQKVREIRRLAAHGQSAVMIAPSMGVHYATVGDVIRRRTWIHTQ